MSHSNTLPAAQNTEASWSMPPVGAPTKSFSACRATDTSSERERPN